MFFTSFDESDIRIAFDASELLDFPFAPVRGDMNFACRIAGFLCPSFSITSRDILKCGSWSTAKGIRQYSSLPDRTFGRKHGTVCIDV